MFQTGSREKLEFDEIPNRILQFYEKHKDVPVYIIIGTDSQNFSDTKMVSVIAVVAEGHGGIFFYEISHVNLIRNVSVKLQTETAASLTLAQRLVDRLEQDVKYEVLLMNCPLSIHVDAGNSDKGKTKMLIPELVGWIKASGYEVKVKPYSFVASSIADKISK